MSNTTPLLQQPKPWATPIPAAVPASPPTPTPNGTPPTTAPTAAPLTTAPTATPAPTTTASPPTNNLVAQPDIAVVMQRDLAVQLVGSDAGKARRIRPQAHAVKALSPAELVTLSEIMQPFLDAEIRRVHEDKRHRLMTFPCQLTRPQAQVLKRCCLAYAAHLREHLSRHPGDSRYNRSQQRLDQATTVAERINAALGTPFDDGLTVATHAQLILAQAQALSNELAVLGARLAASSAPGDHDAAHVLADNLLRLRPVLATLNTPAASQPPPPPSTSP